MSYMVSDADLSGELLIQEIIAALKRLPEAKLPELYQQWRLERGRYPRPLTGPLPALGTARYPATGQEG